MQEKVNLTLPSTTDTKKVSHSEKHTREADCGFHPQSGNLLIEKACTEETLEKHETMAEGTK